MMTTEGIFFYVGGKNKFTTFHRRRKRDKKIKPDKTVGLIPSLLRDIIFTRSGYLIVPKQQDCSCNLMQFKCYLGIMQEKY